jgi:murein DD-endopeptidase MepM/ murein hydrolase activator NlpD
MSIGSVLLQPQRLERSLLISAQTSLGDDFLSLTSRIAFDPVGSDQILNACESAFQGIGQRMLDNAGDGLERAVTRLRALGQPLLDGVSAFAASPPDVEDSAAFFDFTLGIVDAVVAVAESLTAEKLRALVAEVQDILVTELKLGPAFLESVLWLAVDEVIATLEGLALEGDADATRHALVALLRRIKRCIQGLLTIPALSTDEIAANLLDALRRAGLQVFIDEAKCIAEAVRALRTAGTSVAGLAARFGAGSVGAAEAKKPESGDRYCYYPTWLASTEGRPTINFSSFVDGFLGGLGWTVLGKLPGFPDDEVWVTADGKQVIRRNVFRADEVLHEGSNLQWYEAPLYAGGTRPGYTFKHLTPEFMEAWAGWSAVSVDFLKGLMHMIEVPTEPEDFASNLFHCFWNWTNFATKMSGQPPLIGLLNNAIGGPQALRWVWNSFPGMMTALAALENRHTKADERKFLYYLTLLGEDALEAITYDAIFNTIRDVFLSLFTLINYDGAAYPSDGGDDDRPLNRKHLEVWVSLSSLGMSKLLTLLMGRDVYNYPFAKDNDAMYAWWFAGSAIAGALAGFLGAGIGSFALAQASDAGLLFKTTGKAAITGVLMFWPTIYGLMEGDTGGGTYNPSGGADFAGYPDHETSPYRLPYAGGTHQFCGQGNQGMWSHHASSEQVYSYDFGLDQGTDVVAARDGTVVDYFDWVANDIDPKPEQKREAMKRTLTDPYLLIDGQSGFLESADRTEEKIDENDSQSVAANFVLIRHDDPFGTETDEQREAHDRGPGGTQVVTYGAYLHGRLNGVRDVLTAVAPGNDATKIIGLQIRRGQRIMLAGHTGNSAHNHVHFNVQTDGSTSPTASPPITKGSMTGSDIPFVFQEVTHIIGTDGVPKALNHYTSQNEP